MNCQLFEVDLLCDLGGKTASRVGARNMKIDLSKLIKLYKSSQSFPLNVTGKY